MPAIKEPRTFSMRGINTNLSNRLDHNTLTSNIQNGDNNYEKTENVNNDENIQQQTTVIHDVHGVVHIHTGQGFTGGSAMQNPKSNNYLTTDHALTILFALIGLSVVAIAIGIGVSCCLQKKKKNKKRITARIQRHKEISQSQREIHLLKEIETLKKSIANNYEKNNSRKEGAEEVRRAPDGFEDIYPSLSDVSEI